MCHYPDVCLITSNRENIILSCLQITLDVMLNSTTSHKTSDVFQNTLLERKDAKQLFYVKSLSSIHCLISLNKYLFRSKLD
jgi:Na+/proline symporter